MNAGKGADEGRASASMGVVATAQPEGFKIRYSAPALAQLEQMRANALASPKSSHATIYDAVHKLVTEMEQQTAQTLLSPSWALGNKEFDLRGVYRLKAGRLRLFYVASSEKRLVVVLMLGYRKEGDRKDAYREVARRIRKGEFDLCFTEVGCTKPSC